MDLKYTQNITNEGEATILLYSTIGNNGINGQMFADELDYIVNVMNAKKVNVRINSGGGSIVDGYAMVTSILNCEVPVDTYIDGLAASMAGIVAMCGEKIYMNDYALFMMHNPSGRDNAKILEYFKDTLVGILSKRCSLSPEKISDMMDVETWLNSKECKSMGLIDEIVKTKKKVKVDTKNTSVDDIMNIYNNLINQKEIKKMDLITNKLGLVENSTEETIVNSIVELQGQRDKLMEDLENAEKTKSDLEIKMKELENKIEEFNKEKEEAEKAKIEAEKNKVEEMVNSFVASAKIKSEDKDKYVKLASIDFDTTKDMLERMGVKNHIDLSTLINKKSVASVDNNGEEMDFMEMSKKNPAGLEKMRNETPELFENLYNEWVDKIKK